MRRAGIIVAILVWNLAYAQDNVNAAHDKGSWSPDLITAPGMPAVTQGGNDRLEIAWLKLQSFNVLERTQKKVDASDSNFNVFLAYYHDKIYGDDRNTFWKLIESGQIKSDADIGDFANKKVDEYTTLYPHFLQIEKDYPSSITEYSRRPHTPSTPATACNPACDNVDFENGSLSGWSAYYCTNTSNTSFTNTAPTGGPCGAVTRSAYDPSSLTYQVTLTSGTGFDPIAGPFIPIVCPTGGLHSCRIGDSTKNGSQIGILQQSFKVTAANANFTYMYAVVLENPSHSYFDQPYFNVQLLDSNGNLIPNCGNYSVVSGPGLLGYKAIYYPTDGDTCYCKPWTNVFVPLQAYIGQCITIKITAADCSLGGHFGYAYFDAICSANLFASAPVICGKNIKLTAPPGAASYLWSGPCIVGSNTSQTITIGCAGTYSVILTSVSNSICTDTVSITVPAANPPIVTITGHTNVSCHGGNNASATAVVTSGTAPYKYLWSPSGGTNLTATNLKAGTYTITVLDSNGCIDTASVVITQPPVLTATTGSIINVKCNGGNNGSATVTSGGGTVPYTYTWSNGQTSSVATNLSAGTYTVTVKDSNGCTITATATITQPTVLKVTTGSIVNVTCNGGNNGASTATASGGVTPYAYSWTSGSTSSNATGLTAGTYTITVTDANGCSATANATITQPNALSDVVSSVTATCGNNNGSASITAGGGVSPYHYSWSNGKTTTSITNLSAGTYTVTVKDANGCIKTDSIVVKSAGNETATIAFVSNVKCFGGSNGSAASNVIGGTLPYTYSWSTGSTSPTATGLVAGSYTLTVTDSNGCISTVSAVITQPPALVVNTTVLGSVSCNGGNNGSATATVSGGVPGYTYSWSNGQTNSANTGLTAGTYTISVTDANGCVTTANVTITQPATLTTSISTITNVSCFGNSDGTANTSTTGGTTPYAYSWSSGQTTANVTGLNVGGYTVTVTDANGCTASASTTITQPTALTITKTTLTAHCSLADGSASATVGGGTSPYTYSWSNGTTTANINNVTSGTYCLTVTDSHGCVDTACVIIPNTPGETATISSVTNVSCHGGNNGSATVTTSGGTTPYTYSWNNGQTNSIATILTAGSYTITVTDASGCVVTANIIITQPATLVSTGSTPQTICIGQAANLFVNTTGGTSPYTYAWSNGATTSSITVSPVTTTTYTETTTDANGCMAVPVTITITVNPVLNVTAGNPAAACPGNSVTLSANAGGGDGIYTYTWNPGNINGQTITVVPATTGYYTVTVNDACGTPDVKDSILVTVDPLPLVKFKVDTDAGCYPVCIRFTDETTIPSGGLKSWSWNFGNDQASNSQNPTNCYSTPGVYTVTLSVTSDSGCTSTLTASNLITVYQHPTADFSFTPTRPDLLDPFVSFKDLSTDIYGIRSWQWTFGDNSDSAGTLQNPMHVYTDTGKFCPTLKVTNIYGCTDSVTRCLEVSADFTFYIPNAFSPNGDGLNDVFMPKGEHFTNYEMYIFDRWGMMLFHSEDPNKGWDGTMHGTICQEDTYIYLITLKDNNLQDHTYIGKVTLIR